MLNGQVTSWLLFLCIMSMFLGASLICPIPLSVCSSFLLNTPLGPFFLSFLHPFSHYSLGFFVFPFSDFFFFSLSLSLWVQWCVVVSVQVRRGQCVSSLWIFLLSCRYWLTLLVPDANSRVNYCCERVREG